MRKYIPVVLLPLTACAFIYVFYRTDRTVINQLFISVFSDEEFKLLRVSVQRLLPLPKVIIYSLPEGLWMFCITVISRFFYFTFSNKPISLIYFPLVWLIALEFCQLLHITNGRFDILDIAISVFFWLIALLVTKPERDQFVPMTTNLKTIACLSAYCLIWLAHVIP